MCLKDHTELDHEFLPLLWVIWVRIISTKWRLSRERRLIFENSRVDIAESATSVRRDSNRHCSDAVIMILR